MRRHRISAAALAAQLPLGASALTMQMSISTVGVLILRQPRWRKLSRFESKNKNNDSLLRVVPSPQQSRILILLHNIMNDRKIRPYDQLSKKCKLKCPQHQYRMSDTLNSLNLCKRSELRRLPSTRKAHCLSDSSVNRNRGDGSHHSLLKRHSI